VDRSVLAGYADAAAELIPRYEAVSSADLYAAVAHLMPAPGARVLDVGAGTGRDAAWLAARGCRVLAVEPVAAFRRAGAARHASPRIEWLDDSLPALADVRRRGQAFDFVLVSAVWQHLDDARRADAMATLNTLTAPGGRLLLSVRHGPGAPTRPCFPASPEEAVALARAHGLRLVLRRATASKQVANRRAGVTWTWLLLARNDEAPGAEAC